MAAGDDVVKIAEVRIINEQSVVVEYRVGIEAKGGEFRHTGGRQVVLTWPEFLALLSSGQKDAFETFWGVLTAQVKAKDPSVASAIDGSTAFKKV